MEDDDFFLRSLAPALDKTDPDDVEGSDESLTKVPRKTKLPFLVKATFSFFPEFLSLQRKDVVFKRNILHF